jgi:hypothetical protein
LHDSDLGEPHLDLPFLLQLISWPVGHFRGRNTHAGAPPPSRHGRTAALLCRTPR